MVYDAVDAEKIGNALKELRIRKNETQEELANAVGISPSAVAMYETGGRIPRDEIKISLAEHYRVSVESIFFPAKQHEVCDGGAT